MCEPAKVGSPVNRRQPEFAWKICLNLVIDFPARQSKGGVTRASKWVHKQPHCGSTVDAEERRRGNNTFPTQCRGLREPGTWILSVIAHPKFFASGYVPFQRHQGYLAFGKRRPGSECGWWLYLPCESERSQNREGDQRQYLG